MGREIIEWANAPDSVAIGRWFVGHSYSHSGTRIYFCDSYDPSIGYWMTDVIDGDRKNVSERAIGRTFHRIYEDGFCQWHEWGRGSPAKTEGAEG